MFEGILHVPYYGEGYAIIYYSELDAIMLTSEESRSSIFRYLSLGQH